jgi:hypothetical protein
MMIARSMLLALALAGGVAASPLSDAPVERIAGEVSSWGRLVTGWSIDRKGEARSTEHVGKDFSRYWLVTRRAQVGEAGFRTIAGLVQPLRAKVGVDPRCRPGATDGPYGEVTWTSGRTTARFGFNASCISQQSDVGFERSGRARARVERWTRNGEVIERKWMGPPGQQ